MSFRIPARLVAGGFIFLAAGCATLSTGEKPLASFSFLVSGTTNATTTAFALIQEADVDQLTARASTKSALKEREFDFLLHPQDLLQRRLVLQALSDYAAKLKELSRVEDPRELQSEIRSLAVSLDSSAASIHRLAGSPRPAPSGLAGALADIAQSLAALSAVSSREEAIGRILRGNNTRIRRLCGLLASELEAPDGLFYDQVQKAYRDLQRQTASRFTAAGKDEAKKERQARQYAEMLRRREMTLAYLSALGSAYRKMGAAHAALDAHYQQRHDPSAALEAFSAELQKLKVFASQLGK
jgi:hypothetical protein